MTTSHADQAPTPAVRCYTRALKNARHLQAIAPGVSAGGVLTSDITAAQVPGSDILQLFYRGQDNGVWSRWRNPDGTWSSEQDIGGSLS